MTSLRDKIVFLLNDRAITQKQATEKGGFKNSAFINDILRGHKINVTGRNLTALAQAFSNSESFLLGQTDDPSAADRLSVRGTASTTILELDIRAGASYGGGSDADEWNKNSIYSHKPLSEWSLPKAYSEAELNISPESARIIRILGDSMDDGTRNSLASGDRVIVDCLHTDVRQGGIFAVWDGDGVIVKQVELIRTAESPTIICKSRNASYEPIILILDGNSHVIGRVVGKISRV